MLTLFSIPKAFEGHTGIIQTNAVNSWTRLHPEIEIFLCADDAGVAETAKRFGTGYLPDIERNEFGTPLVSSAFAGVRKIARHDTVCFVNADIILLDDFVDSVARVPFTDYLIAGQRWDVPITALWDFESPLWDTDLRDFSRRFGTLHIPAGSDYFVLPKNSVLDLPPLAVGRPGWDNWFLRHARKHRLPVVDGTRAITVLHQNHDYSHVKTQNGHTADGKIWTGAEVEKQRQIIGDAEYYDLLDCTHLLQPSGVQRATTWKHMRRRWYRFRQRHPELWLLYALIDRGIPASAKRHLRALWDGQPVDRPSKQRDQSPSRLSPDLRT